MPTTLEAPIDPPETIADLVERLGGISIDRIRMTPVPGTATEEDVLALEARADKRLCELIDGVLVEKIRGLRESLLASFLITVLDRHIRSSNAGIVTAPDGFVRLFVGRVRIPDVSFISWASLPGRRIPDEPIPMVAPDLVVEVLSKGNTKGEMELKRQDYFGAGTKLMGIAQPKNRTVRVYTAPESYRELNEDDILDGGDVLPGFTLPLREWFGELDRHG